MKIIVSTKKSKDMENLKEAILRKTNRGLDIYMFLLGRFYPHAISNPDDHPIVAANPFNGGRETLRITEGHDVALHYDVENAIAPGDAFSFAQMVLQTDEKCLHAFIARCMCLDIPFKFPPLPALFSFYTHPVTNVRPGAALSIAEVYERIRGNDYARVTDSLRKITDPEKARLYKKNNFDYVTFSGVFVRRNDANLVCHSGLLAIDFDHVGDTGELKKLLLDDPFFETVLMFVSPSGDGLKWIIPIMLDHVSHREYHSAVLGYLRQAYGLKGDASGKDISRACFLPHDPDVYINPEYMMSHEEKEI
jgi:hypothetical protein